MTQEGEKIGYIQAYKELLKKSIDIMNIKLMESNIKFISNFSNYLTNEDERNIIIESIKILNESIVLQINTYLRCLGQENGLKLANDLIYNDWMYFNLNDLIEEERLRIKNEKKCIYHITRNTKFSANYCSQSIEGKFAFCSRHKRLREIQFKPFLFNE